MCELVTSRHVRTTKYRANKWAKHGKCVQRKLGEGGDLVLKSDGREVLGREDPE